MKLKQLYVLTNEIKAMSSFFINYTTLKNSHQNHNNTYTRFSYS